MSPDASTIKQNILSIIETKGPSLPAFIAQETGLSHLFASAFLSELIADKKLKISNMHVGSSPLYLISGQEPMLENFSQHLKNKEKEAYQILKERRFIKDKESEPAIRVALRTIKDFAIPFQRDNEILWRYFTIPESDYYPIVEEPKQIVQSEEIRKPNQEEPRESIREIVITVPNEIEDKKSKKKEAKKLIKKPKQKINKSKDDRNKFFNRIKEFLLQKHIEIIDIEEIGINKIIFKVKEKRGISHYCI